MYTHNIVQFDQCNCKQFGSVLLPIDIRYGYENSPDSANQNGLWVEFVLHSAEWGLLGAVLVKHVWITTLINMDTTSKYVLNTQSAVS